MSTPVFTRTTRRRLTFAAALVVLGAAASLFFYTSTRAAGVSYYSRGSLPPELVTSWSTTRDGLGAPPTNFTGGDIFVIQNTHNMTNVAAWAISGAGSKLQIESGGTLTANAAVTLNAATTFQIDGGGTYVHNNAVAYGSTIFQGTESFAAASTVVLNNSNATGPSGVTFGNLTVNFTTDPGGSVNLSGAITNIAGNLTVSNTQTREFRLTANSNVTLTVGGDLVVQGGTLALSSGTGVPTINLGGSFNQSGGAVQSSAVATITFTGGSSLVGFTRSAGTLTGTNINWSIASGKTVQLNSGFTLAASRSFGINAGGLLLAAASFTNNGAVNVNGEFRLTDGGNATGNDFVYAGGTLGFVASGSYVVNGAPAYWPTTNGPTSVNVLGLGMTLDIPRTVTGGTVAVSAGLGNAGNLTVGPGTTFQLNSGGFVSGSPTYAATSTLIYNAGGSYGRAGEWLPGAASGAGYPYNVRLSNSTTLDLPNGSTAQAFQMAGDLAVDAGSTLSLAGSSPLAQPLRVLGSVSNSGALVLSTAPGGDLEVGNNWTRAAAAAFTANGRAVTFNGTTNQIVSVQGGGTETFAYLIVDKVAGSLTPDAGAGFVTDLAVNATTGSALRLLNAGGLNLNGRTLALDGNGGDLLASGGARSVSGPGAFVFNGAKTVTSASGGTLGFGGGVNVNLNAALTLSADTTVNGTLALGANNVTTTGGNALNIGAAGSVTRTTGYVIGTEQKSFNGAGGFTFDVGTADGYTPVDASVTAGAGSLSVKATQTKHPHVAGANALSRYWTLAGSGVTSNLTFHYLAGDVAGAEASYKIFKYDGGTFTQFTPDALDTTNHTATLNNVSSFSDWTLAEPAAVFGPVLSVGDVSVAEPSSGISYAVFPVTLSAVSAQPVTVSYATADGTATQPGDYTSASGTVIFEAGETSKTIAVTVRADALSDAPEDFTLSLSSPSNATVADGTGVATITAPVGSGTVLISEFRLRGPGTGGSAPTDYDAPVVTLPSGHKVKPRAKKTAEEGDSAAAPRPPVTDDGGGGTNAPPTLQETDEFVEIYNNTDSDIVVADANPVSCLSQVITAGPTTACGWALVDLQGATSNIPRFVIPAGTVIPARGHYLAAGTGYSLSGLAAPDLTYDPPAYSGGEADYTGLALFRTADRAQFTPANVHDAVGFDGVATPYREGSGLPLFGVAEDVQHSFVRNQPSSLPSDTGDNRADFTLVATDPAQLLSGTATLGAPGPENSSGLVARNGGFGVTIPPGILSSVRSLTPVTNGSLGTLSLRRRFTNNTGQSLDRLRFRVVQATTYNNKQVFSNQADVRVLDAQLAGLGGTGLLATTVETPPAQTSGGGVNTGLVVSGSLVLSQPLAAGQSVDVEFLLGVMRGGSYQFVVVVEGAP